MAVTRDEVARVAGLAKLALSDDETEALRQELSRILEYVEKLRELDLAGVDPSSRALAAEGAARDDGVGAMLDRDEALANAPDTDGRHFRVPGFLPEG